MFGNVNQRILPAEYQYQDSFPDQKYNFFTCNLVLHFCHRHLTEHCTAEWNHSG